MDKDFVKNTAYGKLFTKGNAVDTSKVVKKYDWNTKFEEIEQKIPSHYKYIITLEFNKLTKKHFDERLKQGNLVSRNDIGDFIKMIYFDENLKNLLIIKLFQIKQNIHTQVEKKLNDMSKKVKLIPTKILTKNLIKGYSFVVGKSYFSNNGLQKYIKFHPLFNTSKLRNPDDVEVLFWRSLGISSEKIEFFDIKVMLK